MTTTCHNISISLYVMTTLLFYSKLTPKRFLTIRAKQSLEWFTNNWHGQCCINYERNVSEL